jgi:hypothetical protein
MKAVAFIFLFSCFLFAKSLNISNFTIEFLDKSIKITDTTTKKVVLSQKIDTQGLNYNKDTIKEQNSTFYAGSDKVLYYLNLDFDKHKDFVVLSSIGSYRVYLYRDGKFVHFSVLDKLFDCCSSYKKDSKNGTIISTIESSNSAIIDYWTYKIKSFYKIKKDNAILLKQEIYDNDICSLQRKTTTYYNKAKPTTKVEYLDCKDYSNGVFLEAKFSNNNVLKLCKSAALSKLYGHLVFDKNAKLLTPYEDIEKTIIYKDGNKTYVKYIDNNSSVQLVSISDKTLLSSNKSDNLLVTKGSLNDAFKKTNNRHCQKSILKSKSLFNKQHSFIVSQGCADGLMVVEDLLKKTKRTYRVEVVGGGYYILSAIWGKKRNLLYIDNAQELFELNLTTSKRRIIFAYDSLGSDVKMLFTKNSNAILWIDDYDKIFIYYIDLKTLKSKKLATKSRNVLKDFTLNKDGLLLLMQNGKSQIVKLP